MQTNIMQRTIYFYLDSFDGVQNDETRAIFKNAEDRLAPPFVTT